MVNENTSSRSNSEIISRQMNQSGNNNDRYESHSTDFFRLPFTSLNENPESKRYVIDRLKGQRLMDIGSASHSPEELSDGHITDIFGNKMDFNLQLKDFIQVDPYSTKIGPNRYRIDGLSFLLNQEDQSGNVLTAGLDYSILGDNEISNEYCRRLVQEAYRVAPKNGIWISYKSEPLEVYAREIFDNFYIVNAEGDLVRSKETPRCFEFSGYVFEKK